MYHHFALVAALALVASAKPTSMESSSCAYVANAHCSNTPACSAVTIDFSGDIPLIQDVNHELPFITKRSAADLRTDNKITTYFFGGELNDAVSTVNFINSIVPGSSPFRDDLPERLSLTRAAAKDDVAVIAGGRDIRMQASSSVYTFSGVHILPAKAQLLVPRMHHTLTATSNGWYLIGGDNGDRAGSKNVFLLKDWDSRNWTVLHDAPVAFAGHAAVLKDDGTIIVCGGRQDKALSYACYEYDIGSDSWKSVTDASIEREGHEMVKDCNGRIWILGGGPSMIEKYTSDGGGVSTLANYSNQYFGIAKLPDRTH